MSASLSAVRLRLQKITAGGTDRGEIAINAAGMVRLYAGDGLRSRLLRTADRVDRAALMYGATAFMGFAAAGATLIVRRKAVWGYLLMLLAGLIAIAGGDVRRKTKNALRLLDTAFPASGVSANLSPHGDLTVTLGDTTLSFAPGEFDVPEATAFVAALRSR